MAKTKPFAEGMQLASRGTGQALQVKYLIKVWHQLRGREAGKAGRRALQ